MDREHVSDRDTCSREIFFLASVCSPLTTAGGVLRSITNKSFSYREVRQVPVLLQDRKTLAISPWPPPGGVYCGLRTIYQLSQLPSPSKPKDLKLRHQTCEIGSFCKDKIFFFRGLYRNFNLVLSFKTSSPMLSFYLDVYNYQHCKSSCLRFIICYLTSPTAKIFLPSNCLSPAQQIALAICAPGKL